MTSVEQTDPYSTPPRQPILPVYDPTEAWEIVRSSQVFVTPPMQNDGVLMPDCTRVVCISDTHGYHRSIPIPTCDILIHGGDFTNFGELKMVKDVSEYFSELLTNGTVKDRIICIAGNHEITFEPDHEERLWRIHGRLGGKSKKNEDYDPHAARNALTNCTYLEDDAVAVGPIQFYGSPWQPEFWDWAFNMPRGSIHSKWEQIPTNTDVLITHGPPLGRGDVTSGNQRTGCVTLMKEVQSRIKPRLHVFGHIHEGHGVTHDGTTMYVNASSVAQNYLQQNRSIVVDVPFDTNLPARLVKPNSRLSSDELLVWLHQNGYEKTATACKESACHLAGNDLIEESHSELCCRLIIHRDDEAQVELKEAMAKLWVESFYYQ